MGQFYNAPWNVANLASGKIGAHNLVQNNGKRNFSQNLSDNDTKKKGFTISTIFLIRRDYQNFTADLMKCASKIYF